LFGLEKKHSARPRILRGKRGKGKKREKKQKVVWVKRRYCRPKSHIDYPALRKEGQKTPARQVVYVGTAKGGREEGGKKVTSKLKCKQSEEKTKR